MDISRVAETLRAHLGTDVVDEDFQTVLAEFDVASIEAATSARYRSEVWDRTSPINGVPAEVVLSEPGMSADGDILLVYRGDRVLIIQPFDPETGAKLTAENSARVANVQVAAVVDSEVTQEVVRAIAPQVSNNRASRKNVDAKKVNELQGTVDQLVLDALMRGPNA